MKARRPDRNTPGRGKAGEDLGIRLNRILSMSGLVSRRKADELITQGRVRVNGKVVTELGTRALWGRESITVDGKEIPWSQKKLYLMLNKPFGYISSLRDPLGRPTVRELLSDIEERIYPVGRLDVDSLGLLLLTNDGLWASRLTHPGYGLRRTYKAIVKGSISEEALSLLEGGVELEDGPSGPAKISVLKKGGKSTTLRITISQGRNRQVRRMLAAVGYEVVHLLRIGFGPLALGDLKMGKYRHLSREELEAINKLVGLS